MRPFPSLRLLPLATLALVTACGGPTEQGPGSGPTPPSPRGGDPSLAPPDGSSSAAPPSGGPTSGPRGQATPSSGPTSAPRGHAPPPVSTIEEEVEPGEGRSPEQLGKAIMAGFDDLDLVPSLYPTDALLRRALDCQDEEIYQGIAAMRAKAPSEMGARPAGSKLVYLRTTEATGYGESELHPPGAEISGCTTKMEVELRVYAVDYTMITLQGSEMHKLVMLYVRFGDYGWYVFE